jgi:hypothetical protein
MRARMKNLTPRDGICRESLGTDSLIFDRFRVNDAVARANLCKNILLCTQARSTCKGARKKCADPKNLRTLARCAQTSRVQKILISS